MTTSEVSYAIKTVAVHFPWYFRPVYIKWLNSYKNISKSPTSKLKEYCYNTSANIQFKIQ
jgi:hypothetical protein